MEKYGRLTVIDKGAVLWRCQCDCGAICEKRPGLVTMLPEASSCGCLMREVRDRQNREAKALSEQRKAERHVAAQERRQKREARKAWRREMAGTYTSWYAMHARCYDACDPGYRWYGARGIQICERWHRRNQNGFDNFAADMGKRLPGYSIERVNCNGNYTPHNCKWIPRREQPKNTRRTERTATRRLVLKVRSDLTYA